MAQRKTGGSVQLYEDTEILLLQYSSWGNTGCPQILVTYIFTHKSYDMVLMWPETLTSFSLRLTPPTEERNNQEFSEMLLCFDQQGTVDHRG